MAQKILPGNKNESNTIRFKIINSKFTPWGILWMNNKKKQTEMPALKNSGWWTGVWKNKIPIDR